MATASLAAPTPVPAAQPALKRLRGERSRNLALHSARSTDVERALALLRRAVADCGYTVDDLESSIGRSRAHIYRVLHGQTPMSLRFFFALPADVEARFEQLRLAHLGGVIARPSDEEEQRRGVRRPRRPGVWSKGDRLTLRRYLVTWTDGVTRVIHARRLTSARELAAQLEVPDGVFVRTVKPMR